MQYSFTKKRVFLTNNNKYIIIIVISSSIIISYSSNLAPVIPTILVTSTEGKETFILSIIQ